MHLHWGTVVNRAYSYDLRKCRCGMFKTSFYPQGGYSPRPVFWPRVDEGWITASDFEIRRSMAKGEFTEAVNNYKQQLLRAYDKDKGRP